MIMDQGCRASGAVTGVFIFSNIAQPDMMLAIFFIIPMLLHFGIFICLFYFGMKAKNDNISASAHFGLAR
jgi:hypothetical protein